MGRRFSLNLSWCPGAGTDQPDPIRTDSLSVKVNDTHSSSSNSADVRAPLVAFWKFVVPAQKGQEPAHPHPGMYELGLYSSKARLWRGTETLIRRLCFESSPSVDECEVDILRVSVLGREYDALRSAEQFIAARKVTERWAGGTCWARWEPETATTAGMLIFWKIGSRLGLNQFPSPTIVWWVACRKAPAFVLSS